MIQTVLNNLVTVQRVANGYIITDDEGNEYVATSVKHTWSLGGISVESVLDSIFNPPKEPNPIDKEADLITL